MRALSLLLAILIIIAITPLADGYFFKQAYYQHIVLVQEKIEDPKVVKVEIKSYDFGWMKSTAVITLTTIAEPAEPGKYHLPPSVSRIKSVIHHGPLVYFNNKFHIASAYVETYVDLPDILKVFIPQGNQGFMQIYSEVSLDCNTWKSHYAIPAISFQQYGNWDGMTGDLVFNTENGQLVSVKSNFISGKFHLPSFDAYVPEIQVDTIEGDSFETKQPQGIWDGYFNLKSAGVSGKWLGALTFSYSNLLLNSTAKANGKLYNYDDKLNIDSLQLPSSLPVNNFSKIYQTLSLKNLNADALRSLNEYFKSTKSNEQQAADAFLKVLSPTTTVDITTGFKSELGAASTSLNLSLKALPKTEQEIYTDLNVDFNLRIAQPLLEILFVTYFTKQPDSSSDEYTDPAQQVKTFFGTLLQQGFIQQDKDDYIFAFSRIGVENKLNGKAMSDNDMVQAMATIHQDIVNVTTPSAPVAAPVAAPVVVAPPASAPASVPAPAPVPVPVPVKPASPVVVSSTTTPITSTAPAVTASSTGSSCESVLAQISDDYDKFKFTLKHQPSPWENLSWLKGKLGQPQQTNYTDTYYVWSKHNYMIKVSKNGSIMTIWRNFSSPHNSIPSPEEVIAVYGKPDLHQSESLTGYVWKCNLSHLNATTDSQGTLLNIDFSFCKSADFFSCKDGHDELAETQLQKTVKGQ